MMTPDERAAFIARAIADAKADRTIPPVDRDARAERIGRRAAAQYDAEHAEPGEQTARRFRVDLHHEYKIIRTGFIIVEADSEDEAESLGVELAQEDYHAAHWPADQEGWEAKTNGEGFVAEASDEDEAEYAARDTGAKPAAPSPLTLDARELATVLAALRHFQADTEANSTRILRVDDIATDGGTLDPLTVDQIDALCERLNMGGAA